MQPGISSYAFGWAVATPSPPSARAFTADTLLDFAVAQRVPVVQFGDNLPLHALDDHALSALAARARREGLKLETGARGFTPDHLQRYIEISRRLDARFLRFVIDAKGYEPAVDAVVHVAREALPELHAANLVLGIENHDRFPCRTLRAMIDAIASEHVGICLDTANSFGAGEGVAEILEHLAPVCVNLHVKDFAIERLSYLMGFTISGRALGGGMLPLDEVLTAVAKHPRCHTAVIETWPPPEPDIAATLAKEVQWAEQSVTVLRRALDRLNSPHRAS